MARPPFTGQRTYGEDRARAVVARGELNAALAAPGALAAAARQIERARESDPENLFLLSHAAAVRLQLHDAAGALALNEKLATLQPPSPEQTVQRAAALLALRRGAEAEAALQEAVRAEPYYFQTYGLLAQAWHAAHETAKGRAHFAELARRMPESRAVRIPLAQFCQAAGDWPAAEAELRAVLGLVPDEEGALAPLVQRLEATNRREAALELMLAAYAYNPRSFANNSRLVERFETTADEARTVEFMEALAESGPVNAQLFLALAERLPRIGRAGDVPVALVRAYRAAVVAGDAALARSIVGRLEATGLLAAPAP
jgi:predicted Zn-dependent protease